MMNDTPSTNRLIEQQIRQLGANYKLTPATLAYELNPSWIPSPHLMYISSKVASTIIKGNGRLLISLPPRHGKSELITKWTTIWNLEKFPSKNTILASYGAELAQDFGREVRDIIIANEDKLDITIRKDASKVGNWKTPEGGGMASVGIGGPITGRGADVFFIDDFIKEIKEAQSQAYRDYLWNWFVTVALTRLEPGATMIIIATRWDHDDLIGRIQKQNPGGRWENIQLPALAEENDPLGRAIDEPLFPERYPYEELIERKETLGSFFFNALFQQHPDNDESKLTDPDWLEVTDQMPELDTMKLGRIWDLAATQDAGDYTAGALCCYEKPKDLFYVINMVRKRLSPSGVEKLVRKTAIADGLNTIVYIEQEPGASGKALVEHYANTVLPEFKVVAVPASDGKLTRAQPFLAAAEAGKVRLIKGSWNALYIDEFKDFPGGKHDDQIDVSSMGYTKLSGKKSLSASWGRRRNKVATKPVAEGHRQGKSIIFGRRRR